MIEFSCSTDIRHEILKQFFEVYVVACCSVVCKNGQKPFVLRVILSTESGYIKRLSGGWYEEYRVSKLVAPHCFGK